MLSTRAALGCGAILALTACGGSNNTNASTTSGSGGTTGVTSGSTGGTSGTGGTKTTSTTSAGTGGTPPVPAAPQVANLGGTVLATPKVQLIAYASDPMAPDADAFITEFGATQEWAEQTSEYGVGAFTKLPTIMLSGTPPTTIDDNSGQVTPFEQMIAANVSGTNPAWAPEDGNTMYVYLVPLGTNVSSGGSCCSDFLGYHYDAPLATGSAPYAVICDCPQQKGDPTTPLIYVTTTISHEMVESATDPFPDTAPAYAQNDDADFIWTIATGGEVADMCEFNTDSNYTPPGSTYAIQRSWSDAAAKAGNDPCVPVASTAPYFNSYPIMSDTIALNYYGMPVNAKGVNIAVGATKTIDVVLSSKGATSGPWNVKAYDLNYFLTGGTANTTLTLDKSSGSDGDVLHLTIKVVAYNKDWGGAGFVLDSTLDGQDNITIGGVGK